MKLNFLNKEFSVLDRKQDRYFLIGVILVFSMLFLNVFEPWNIGRWYSDSGFIQFLRLSSYGVVVALVFLFTQFTLRKWFHKEKFRIKDYILWLLIEISIISLVYIFLYGNPIGNFLNDLVFSLKYTLLGIFLPYSFGILLIYYRNQRQKIKELQTKMAQPSEKRMIAFRDENDKIKFSVLKKDLLLLESTDNYVSVKYCMDGKTHRKLLRNTLKNLEDTFKDESIIRCHRSFMINVNNIEFVQKEGKKLIVKLKNIENSIPVSPKYSPLFLDYLS